MAPLDWEIVNENRVAADSEFITERPSTGHAWIRQHSQPLLSQKKSMKTESVPTHKWSPKHHPLVTPGFVRAHNPYWYRNSKWKLSHCWLRNQHRNRFHRWRVYSSVPTAPIVSEIVNNNWVAADSEMLTETPYKGEACIQKRSQPLLTQEKSMKTESVPTRKSSTKHLPKVMRGFVSAHSPTWLRNSQQKWSRCRLRNHHRNTFQRWRAWIQNFSQPSLTKKKLTKTE
jgi:hypothetical protein